MLTPQGYNVIPAEEAILILSQSRQHFVLYLGAGASVEVGVPTAAGICGELAEDLIRLEEKRRLVRGLSPATLVGKERDKYLNDQLEWDDEENRYFNCVTRVLSAHATRVDYFRRKLEHVKPAFAHYACCMLMTNDHLARTALTTNFDKLLENAFAELGESECQAIRMPEEIQFWRHLPDKCYLLKLHGDYDTHNLLNTDDETVALDPKMVSKAQGILMNAGMLVLGSAGREKSIHTFMDSLATDMARDSGILEHGLLWGVYIGPEPEGGLRKEQIPGLIEAQINAGAVGKDIVKLMKRRAKDQPTFAFFPVVGCGSFLWDVVRQLVEDSLVFQIEQYLDHGLRIGEIFRRKGLSEAARKRHIRALQEAQDRLKSLGSSGAPHDYVFELGAKDSPTRVWLAYGNVADDKLVGDPRLNGLVKAIVSPEDTCLSVGGGAALAIAQRAGLRDVLHDVYKFAPIPQGTTAVTSAGRLRVHYLIHAASVEVTENGASTDEAAVRRTTRNVLERVAALDVAVVWIPLLGAGVAGMTPTRSAEAIASAISEWLPTADNCIIVVTVLKESMLPRQAAEQILNKALAGKLMRITKL